MRALGRSTRILARSSGAQGLCRARCREYSHVTASGDARGGWNGRKVRQEGPQQGEEGDARAQARHAEERALRQEGEEPQAGDCDRVVRGAARRRQGAEEEVELEEEVQLAEEVELE